MAPKKSQPPRDAASPDAASLGTASLSTASPSTASPAAPATPSTWQERGLLLLSRAVDGWQRLLERLRSQLPPSWRTFLSDSVLTAIVVGLLALVLVLVFGGGKAAPAAEPEPEPEVVEAVEPGRIAEIQDQVAAIAQTYAAELVEAVRADFQRQLLTVAVGSQWYGLRASAQNQLAEDLYGRAQELDFARLYLVDPEDRLVARNPVVGEHMVVLQRQLAPDLGG